ncbi:hypothetical protein JCM3775_005781 [Rhodotorula graminis]|uniref:DASH complex subunit DAD2 n=1 Tax=Rhodotorula graminis (strain WP1) TaxID=578459 RepID=A0A194S4W9_RHOGW|nr:uncharacterized protein RHOBADRAFT_52679 [Rhodotorula graminis WP1]KPV75632.1 hypothetical protein RHOBADRAFT_52679 [Rhodotorula graminis WP1]
MSYRQSMYPGGAAANLAPSNASLASSAQTPAHSRLLDKQREFTAFSHICNHAAQLATFLDEYATRCDTLVGGSEAVGDVVEHWQNVFRATGLAIASIAEQRAAVPPPPDAPEGYVPALGPDALPAKLVRIPVRNDADHDGGSQPPASGEGSGAATPVQA